MTTPKTKYVTSDRPVNRRTATVQAPAVNPVVRERLEAARARNRLGPSLTGQLRKPVIARAIDALMIVSGIVATLSAVTIFLAWMRSSMTLALVGLGLLVGALTLLIWRIRRAKSDARTADFNDVPDVLDEESLEHLDTALARVLTELPDDLATQLTALKALVVRIGRQMGIAADEHFTMDDRFYVRECVRRYLPDSLAAYVQVPRAHRMVSLGNDGQTTDSMLRSQVELIEKELLRIEAKLTESAAQQLVRQQHFLESKATRDS
jgi:hypothetical protein